MFGLLYSRMMYGGSGLPSDDEIKAVKERLGKEGCAAIRRDMCILAIAMWSLMAVLVVGRGMLP